MYKMDSEADKIAFMKQYSFATIVSFVGEKPVATHLPFTIDDSGDKLLLQSHFAKANTQAAVIASQLSLVIFSQPHAYISPTHYHKRESVPTWDYIAVHAYGTARILETDAQKLTLLERMIDHYEKSYRTQWDSLNDKFKTGMLQGIVAFELEVTALQGQQKLSQNKTGEERRSIVAQLEQSSIGTERDLALYIKKL
ncbi:protease synthase and sporulation protein PAI 2 [Filimonas zeae]|uniref:Protease synthase and sporulation protein PAI 2 n=2 Tax=Filimonas zeae TaxID=1737353 RepID=A0A917MWL1_9BACT|nr:protease synthase and sporulation protein PAI 2 [Filimonas zeae]